MYSIDIIKSSINLYFKLKNDGILGKKRIKYIETIFNIHINTLYNWINKYFNINTNTFCFVAFKNNFKYNNKKITTEIENFVICSIVITIILILKKLYFF